MSSEALLGIRHWSFFTIVRIKCIDHINFLKSPKSILSMENRHGLFKKIIHKSNILYKYNTIIIFVNFKYPNVD
jgi:hypothetical protein